jgi:hypothetical protein
VRELDKFRQLIKTVFPDVMDRGCFVEESINGGNNNYIGKFINKPIIAAIDVKSIEFNAGFRQILVEVAEFTATHPAQLQKSDYYNMIMRVKEALKQGVLPETIRKSATNFYESDHSLFYKFLTKLEKYEKRYNDNADKREKRRTMRDDWRARKERDGIENTLKNESNVRRNIDHLRKPITRALRAFSEEI